MLKVDTHSSHETWQLGHLMGTLAQGGEILCLEGELGAGKTTLIQGLAAGLGVGERITSPSFTLVHRHQGRLHLRHIDLYRISPDQVPELGLEEMLAEPGLTAIEWADHLPGGIITDCLVIHMEHLPDEQSRRLALRARGPAAARFLRQLRQARAQEG